jgi:hypothetical protein
MSRGEFSKSESYNIDFEDEGLRSWTLLIWDDATRFLVGGVMWVRT